MKERAAHSRESLNSEQPTGQGVANGTMDGNTQGNGKMINGTGREFVNNLLKEEKFMMVNGLKINGMGTVLSPSLAAESTLANLNATNSRATARTNFLTAASTRANSRTIIETVRDP